MVEKPEFELSGYLEDAFEEAIDDVGDKSDPTNQEEMTRKTISGEQIDSGLIHISCVKEPAGEPNKFSRWEESPSYNSELKLVQSMKVICALDLLVQLFAQKCCAAQCQLPCTVDFTLCGTSVLIKWKCGDGHTGKFCSSHRGEGDSLLTNNLQALADILFSGNNFEKIAKFAGFLGLSSISKTTYYRAQRIYLIPAVTEWWRWQQGEIFTGLQNKDLVVCHDGQCNSPGFTAKNLCYYLMEMTTSYIIDVEVMDKRQVNMRSVTIEKEALLKILRRLKDILHVVDLVTDASASIKKTMGKLILLNKKCSKAGKSLHGALV